MWTAPAETSILFLEGDMSSLKKAIIIMHAECWTLGVLFDCEPIRYSMDNVTLSIVY